MNIFSNTMKTFVAGEALAANRRVKKSGNTVIYADAGEDSIGVTVQAVPVDGFALVKLWNDPGTFLITASGVITANGKCYGANDGKVSATVSGEPVGTSNEEASCADADEIEVIAATAADQFAIQAHIVDVAAVTQESLVLTAMTGATGVTMAAETNLDTLTLTSMLGTANTTPAAETNMNAIAVNSVGTPSTSTMATVTESGNTGSADLTPVRNNFATLSTELATQRALNVVLINDAKLYAEQLVKQKALNTVLINDVKTLATELNAARVDNAAQVTKINALLAALEAVGIVKAS
jgi:hypothetical protein